MASRDQQCALSAAGLVADHGCAGCGDGGRVRRLPCAMCNIAPHTVGSYILDKSWELLKQGRPSGGYGVISGDTFASGLCAADIAVFG